MMARVAIIAAFAFSGALGCGYHALYAQPQESHFSVVLVHAGAADALADDEVISGVRATLAREGALATGTAYPRIEVEVLRADEVSEGVTSVDAPGGRVPRARATEVGISARAWIVRTPGGVHEADTGDVRTFDVAASPPANLPTAGAPGAVVAEGMHHDDALRAVARRVGQRLALRVLGHPVSRDESAEEVW